jgi:hypothetical protein
LLAGTSASATIFGNCRGGTDSSALQMSGSNAVAVITGNLSATAGNNAYGAHMLGTSAQITVTGNVTGGTSNTGNGMRLDGNLASATVVGNVSGSSGLASYGIWLSNFGPSANITGQVSGGTGSSAHGVVHGGSGTVTVTGPVIGGINPGSVGLFTNQSATYVVNGPATARRGLSHAIRSDSTVGSVIFQGDMTDADDGTVAVYTRSFRMTQTAGGVTKYASGPNNPFGTLVSRVDPGNTTGMPAISNVRTGTIYGATNQFTGTVAMPSVGQTMYGVPVDGSTGTAEFDLATVADIVRAQVSAGAYERTTL